MALKEVPSEGLQHHHSEPPPPPASIRVLLLRRHFLAAQSPGRRWCPKGEHVEAVLVWVQNALPPAASPSLLHPSLAACCPLTVVPSLAFGAWSKPKGGEGSWVDAECSSLPLFSRDGHSAQLAQGICRSRDHSGHGGSVDGGAEHVQHPEGLH